MMRARTDVKQDPFFLPLTCSSWLKPAAFVFRTLRLWPTTVLLTAAVVCLLSFVEGLSLSILLPLLSLIGVDTGARPGGPAQVVKELLGSIGIPLALVPVLGIFIVVGLVQIALHALQQYLIVRSNEKLTCWVRMNIFNAASRASWSTLVAGRGGYLVNAIVSEASRAGLLFGSSMTALGIMIGFCVYLALAAWISWTLTLWTGVLAFASMIGLRKLHQSSRRFGKYTSAATNRMQEILNEHIGGAKLIRALGAGEWSQSIFRTAVTAVGDYARRNQVNTILVRTSVEPFGLLLICLLIYLSVTVFQLPAAELMVLLVMVFRLMPRFVVLQEMLQRISGMLPAYESVTDALSRLDQAREPEGTKVFTGLDRAIELKGIVVRHGSEPALDRMDLTVPARTTVALVGRSGGGKTTVLDVISGIVIPEKGQVLLDGVPLMEFDLAAYRQRIGIVSQEGTFFHDTIAENLRVAAPGATEAEMWQALEAAHATEFVQARERRLEEIIGDQGLRLSGGQRQRLALARALLRKPDILLLDEPTSAMDHETELAIRETLKRLHGKVTIVLVTHRSEMAEDADVVYAVSEGLVKPLEIVSGSVGKESAE